MEKPYDSRTDLLQIIEVGSGSGQHLQSVKQPYSNYLMTDIDLDLLTLATFDKSKVDIMQADASNLSEIRDSSFGRLVATCLLAHLSNPMEALVEWRRVVKSGGSIVIYVATEPGFLVRLSRKLFIYPKQRRLGVNNPE
ncbi:MAG: class I SAM-dependent methyltransferase, partial [Actinobacteria bacterium]|nr:class I SAM-dependent methyltransferase [Actinomycetota bacterium]